ncbi:MAG TPA: cyclic nucleotide-binding domain-containing protein [Egibacteraceae bacterium]|nr:cyclic nucleotide-binding domain-containing protein [Egibacteraceae bacterium]
MERITASVTSVSWIPSGLVEGLLRAPFDMRFINYDEPLPDRVGDLDRWRSAALFRFANRLEAWIDVEDGRVVGAGHAGAGVIGRTKLGPGHLLSVPAIGFPDLRPPVERTDSAVRFVQTAGGQPPLLAPRMVTGSRRWTLRPPLVWTTLSLTIAADGSSSFEVVGASQFPRHWIYDGRGDLAQKVGLTDFDEWYHRTSLEESSPWGGADLAPVVTAAESALERELSKGIMHGAASPAIRRLSEGAVLVRQGDPGREVYLVLDGVLGVEVDGEHIADVGPGVVIGERAALSPDHRRTATVRALTPVRVAAIDADALQPDALRELELGHRREDEPQDRLGRLQ